MLWHGAKAGAFSLEAAVQEAIRAFRRAGEAATPVSLLYPPVSPRAGSSVSSLRRGRHHHHLLHTAAAALAAGGGGPALSAAIAAGAGSPGWEGSPGGAGIPGWEGIPGGAALPGSGAGGPRHRTYSQPAAPAHRELGPVSAGTAPHLRAPGDPRGHRESAPAFHRCSRPGHAAVPRPPSPDTPAVPRTPIPDPAPVPLPAPPAAPTWGVSLPRPGRLCPWDSEQGVPSLPRLHADPRGALSPPIPPRHLD